MGMNDWMHDSEERLHIEENRDLEWPAPESLFCGDLMRDVARTLNFEDACAAACTVLLRKYGYAILKRGLEKAVEHDVSIPAVEQAERASGVLLVVSSLAERLDKAIRDHGWRHFVAHLDEGEERKYWHHGRLMAFRDLEAWLEDGNGQVPHG